MDFKHTTEAVKGHISARHEQGTKGHDRVVLTVSRDTFDGRPEPRFTFGITQQGDNHTQYASITDETAFAMIDILEGMLDESRKLRGEAPMVEAAEERQLLHGAELDALGRGSLIQDHEGFYMLKLNDDSWKLGVTSDSSASRNSDVALPATLLYTPTPSPSKES